MIGNTEIRNYIDPRDSITRGITVPDDLAGKEFKPSPVSLNNKVVFIALSTGVGYHDGGKRTCALAGCNIFWNQGSKISKVRILVGQPSLVGNEPWVCNHHSQASINGFQLQTQKVMRKSVGGIKATEKKTEDDVNSKEKKEELEVKASTSASHKSPREAKNIETKTVAHGKKKGSKKKLIETPPRK